MSAAFAGDVKNTAFLGVSVLPQTISSATTVNGSAVDAQTSDDILSLVYCTGNVGDGSTVITIKIQESDASGGTYADITGATVTLAASASANDNLCAAISTRLRSKRYVRGVVTTAGGTPSVPIAAHFIGRKKITHSNTGYTLAPTS